MQYSVAAVLALAAGAAAWENVTYTTEVVEEYVTYCPSPTTITHGSSTYTVTEPTTLTITDCPCTITKPVTTTSSVYCPPTTYPNSTIVTMTPTGTGGVPLPPTDAPPPPTGAATKASVGLAAVVGLAAYLL